MIAQGIREGMQILVGATLLGFTYTAITATGLFAPHQAKSNTSVDSTAAPQFISYEEALQLYNSGSAVFLDGRHAYDFGLSHIKGAMNVPLQDIRDNPNIVGTLQKDKLLVTYCDGAKCNSSIELALKLDSLGYKNVKIFFGGWKEWESHNQPMEK